MISYCIAVFRPTYAQLLVTELIRKTSTQYEILLWINGCHRDFERFVVGLQEHDHPVRVVGISPENRGMQVLIDLFGAAQYELVTQIDDDVVAISRRIAETAATIFARFPQVKQLVADVWQDEYTTGARPDLAHYSPVDAKWGLYDGPVDGWFSIYHRSVMDLVPRVRVGTYGPLGGAIANLIRSRRQQALLCRRMRVLHVIGPQYASVFGMLESEIEKYRRLGRHDIVAWYEEGRRTLPPREELWLRYAGILRHLDQFDSLPPGL